MGCLPRNRFFNVLRRGETNAGSSAPIRTASTDAEQLRLTRFRVGYHSA